MNDIENLINLIKHYEGKPELLATYLVIWDALKTDFKKRVINSDILKNKINKNRKISDIVNFNQKIFEYKEEKPVKNIKNKTDKIDINIEYNNRLQKYLLEEDYESAAILRDLMSKYNIKKNI